MKKMCLIFISFLLIISAAQAATQPVMLTIAEQQATAAFERLDAGLKTAAEKLGETGLTGAAARVVLAALCQEVSYAVDCATVDTQGLLTTIEPAAYRHFEGTDISDQQQVKQMLELHKPVLSGVFRSVEGYDAVDAEYPIFNAEGRFIGSVSVLFKPERFLGEIIQPLVKGTPLAVTVIDVEGRILYAIDPAQIGLNIFTSEVFQPYTDLVQLVRKIVATPEGHGIYRFKREYLTAEDVDRTAFWTSASLYGVDWRLIGIRLEEHTQEPMAAVTTGAVAAEQALELLAADTTFKTALIDDDKDKAITLLEQFYASMPGLYSVQWVNAKGINRFGFPVENSLIEYDYNPGTAESDRQIFRILNKQQADVLEAPLFEGRVGYFTFKPIFSDDRYLGMVYSIKLKSD
ncbi:hypothetical protein SAMN05660860_00688 [Geoalkalibacter ferrihydriticus]|uniref:Dret-0059-like sensor domain-containing protein n=2 Tax=Geoalkalibacter ferrihydriticus TaxID=392333 RepID=A0A0C2HIL3_9BACT|nr:cache domain-containing protein [Geoalkalibacter ferrihydriticus]KIH76886.1 hypothetical protein GFER_07250 [Geoalkalibacter ferrihydriticus DSM 17813]SDL46029.1 hypothetical protein SAMN05660860_00688 [Geoalkalibacter ferrihydriticus]